MANVNGQQLLRVLQNLHEPATFSEIVSHIANATGVHPRDISESIMDTLHGGVRYGFIQLSKRKYSIPLLSVHGTAVVVECDEAEPGPGAEVKAGDRKGGDVTTDSNQNNQLEEKKKRKKGGKK